MRDKLLSQQHSFPLPQLLKKGVKYELKPEQEDAFQHLKAKLTSQPIIQYPGFSKEFILITDASNAGLGVVLSQGPLGKYLSTAYASRILNKVEVNYTTRERNYCQLCGQLGTSDITCTEDSLNL